jgi:hypothetical protein
MPRKKRKQASAAPVTVAKPAEAIAQTADIPVEEAKPQFQQLKCTDVPPEGFHGGRFMRNSHPHVVGGRGLMRRGWR